MDFLDYVRAMRRRWWLVVGATMAAVGLAVVVTMRTPPQYATSVTFFVTMPATGVSDAYQGDLFSQQRVKSYADLLTSDRLAQLVAGRAALEGLEPDGVRSRVSARPVPNTVLLRATVVDGSPERSRRIAEVLATEFISLVQALETPPGSATPSVKVELVGGPRLEPAPVSPRPARNLGLAVLLGLIAGSAAAVLREVLDTTVKSVEALRDVSASPVLGTVPYDGAARKAPLIVADRARSARAEAYRRLRTNLQFVDVDGPVRAIVVTSAVPGEGKSTTASNLAIAFGEAGKRVLLVDADLRMPRIAEYLGLEGAVGLTNVLAGLVPVADVVQQWGRGGLWVLPSGSVPPNPSELLGSQNMADLLVSLREDFDMVILDAPPLLPVTDAAIVAARCDGAVLVARYGRTSRSQIAGAMDALRAVDARVLGCLLNMLPPAGGDAYGYDYGYGYGYGYGHRSTSARDAQRRDPLHRESPFADRQIGGRGLHPPDPPDAADGSDAKVSAGRGDRP
jgi:capsular exopolysaccharide synthesis family protein